MLRRLKKRSGFTLIELLVVISIIGMLASLLLPAVNQAREAGRRTQCLNNIKQLGIAVTNYEVGRGRYPGGMELQSATLGTSTTPTNILLPWHVSLFPYMERVDIYDQFITTQATVNSTAAWDGTTYPRGAGGASGANSLYLKFLRCPSNPATSTSDGQQSYIGNAGGELTNEVADGLFLDRVATNQPKVSSSTIIDGLTNTIAFSENLLAVEWSDVSPTLKTSYALSSNSANSITFSRQNNTFIWNYAGPDSTYAMAANNAAALSSAPSLTTPVPTNCKINGNKTKALSITDKTLLRPSSQHPQIAVFGYADGHTAPIKETLDYHVYCQLMTPNHKKSFAPFTTYLFKDEDVDN